MATKPVTIRILGDAKGLTNALDDSESKLGKFGGSVFGVAAKVAAFGAAAGVAGAVVGTKLYDMGVAAESMRKKVETVFGPQADAVRKWADKNNEALGVTDEKLAGMAAGMADLLKPMGFTADQAAKMSTKMLDLSGALSAWSGGQRSAAEVSEILSSAMLGERDALKSLGISISEADIQARLAAKGQDQLTGAALEQAKALATQELILEKSTDAQTAWADGSLDAAKKQNTLKATWDEMSESLSNALQPALAAVATFFVDKLIPGVQKVMEVFDDRGLSGVVELAKTRFGELWPGIKDGLATFGKNVIDWLGEQLPVIAAKLADWGKKFVEWVEPQIPPLLEKLGVLLGDLASWVLVTGVPELIRVMGEMGEELLNWIAEVIPKLPGALWEFANEIDRWFNNEGKGQLASTAKAAGEAFALSFLGAAGDVFAGPAGWARMVNRGLDDGDGISSGGGAFGMSFGGGNFASGVRVTGRPAPGGTWQRIVDMAKATGLAGITASSIFRPGAVTRSGNRSYHASGRAVDFTAPNLNALHQSFQRFAPGLKELIGPIDGLNWRNGRPHRYSAAVLRDHDDHVHAAFDRGGWLPPGVHTVVNGTGRPEPILTDGQWRALKDGGGRRYIAETINVTVANGRTFAEEMRFAEALYGQRL